MTYSAAVIQGLLLGVFIAFSVGPTLFAVIRYSMHSTYKAGLIFVLGVSFSDILYVTLANIATKWLTFLEVHQKEVGYIGSALFMIMGISGLIKKIKPKRPPRSGQVVTLSNTAYVKIWLSGFLMNTLNPGVVLMWVGSVTLISGKEVTTSHKIVLFGVCLGLVLGVDFLKVFLADKIRHKLNARKIIYINRISAAFILILGIVLLLKTLFYK